MHLIVKKEATKPAFFNFLQQQERFDQFIGVFNNVRPHQALTAPTLAISIHRQLEPTSRHTSQITRTTIELSV